MSDDTKFFASEISTEIWDAVVVDLRQNSGIALVDLPGSSCCIPSEAFELARNVLQQSIGNEIKQQPITDDTDSAHFTGYHPAASPISRRYNRCRQGFVWSDGSQQMTQNAEFDSSTAKLENLLHAVAEAVLGGLERHLQLPDSWFQACLGPMRNNSQWHLKRYVADESFVRDDRSDRLNDSSTSSHLLPTHTDPSLISVVIHDRPGKQKGAQGLEYSHKLLHGSREWKEVSHSGHAVAVVFVGSVMAYITGGTFPACKHRVFGSLASGAASRMAATLFLRPAPTALLQVPPSPKLQDVSLKRKFTFDAWSAKVARNYEKSTTIAATNDVLGA
jgi:isopenicillin N synthase-like dioxygenase